MAVPPPSNQSDHEVLAGIVERATFHNADSGFCALFAERASSATHFMLRCDIAYVEASARFLDENRAACI